MFGLKRCTVLTRPLWFQRKEDDVQPPAPSEGDVHTPFLLCLSSRSLTPSLTLSPLSLSLSFAVVQSLMLQIAATWIEQEKKDLEVTKETYMADNCPAPDLGGDQAALMVRTGAEGEECRGRGWGNWQRTLGREKKSGTQV